MSATPTVLQITLLSSACFMGSHDTLTEDASAPQELVSQELDSLGLPMIGGRCLKGHLVEACSVYLSALGAAEGSALAWQEAALRLFGTPGSPLASDPDFTGASLLWIGDARLPPSERLGLEDACRQDSSLIRLAAQAHTELRGQTRIDPTLGAALPHSLRLTRLARRGLVLEAPLAYPEARLLPLPARQPSAEAALLAGAALLLRRGGLHRHRGWGQLQARILHHQQDVTDVWAQPLLARLEAL